VQNTAGAVTASPDCPPQSATVVLGPSPMQNGGARILAAFDPCVLTDGGVVLRRTGQASCRLGLKPSVQASQPLRLTHRGYCRNAGDARLLRQT
jgi:hypothetical protein